MILANTMPRTKRTLAEADPNTQVSAPNKSRKGKAKATSASMEATNTKRADATNGRPKKATSERNDDLNVRPTYNTYMLHF